MGLSLYALSFIIKKHKSCPFRGPVLLLGRQCVYATLEETISLFKKHGVPVNIPDKSFDLKTNIPQWSHTPFKDNISDTAFFKLLGINENEVHAMDITTFENADIVFDLNMPLREDLMNRFNFILDGGTLEHVFDVRRALENISLMLKTGGEILHMSPCSNYIGHALYQFTPGLFFEFYRVNGFLDQECFIFEQAIKRPEKKSAKLYKCLYPHYNHPFITKKRVLVVFCRKKTVSSGSDLLPFQGIPTDRKSLNPATQKGYISKIKSIIPSPVKSLIKSVLGKNYEKKGSCYKYLGKI